LFNSCYDLKEEDCCLDLDESVDFPPKTPVTDLITHQGLGCWCNDINNYDISHDFTYSELTDLGGVKHIGWFGAPLSFVEDGLLNCDNNAQPIYWSGEKIPGIGNIGPLPLGEAIAWKWDGETMNEIRHVGGDSTSLTTEPLCNWHTGPNRYVNIGAELIEPRKNAYGVWGGTPHLFPPTCKSEKIGSGINSFYASCGTPKPFSTYSGGIGTGIQVNKKACWPEVMTVHKIECDDVGYKLHVSREYFEHDRIWTSLYNVSYIPRIGLITGGTDVYRNSCGDYYKECEAIGDTTGLESKDYSFTRPLITPSDTVAPLHPDLCATGTDVYFKTKTSYTGGTTEDTYCAANGLGVIDVDECVYSGCLLFPDISGQSFWNFYNLFEDSHPSQNLIPPSPPDCSESYPYNLSPVNPLYTNKGNPVFSSVSELRGAHSCFQDFPECGGDLWCNKEFFPRRSYKANTKITKFAALSICTQTSEFEAPAWYEGHGTTWDASPNKSMLGTGPFIDACDPDVRVLAQSGIGIDDNIIYIPHRNSSDTSDSILTLMGVVHPGFKADVNEKTCIYAKSGECVDFLPKHTDRTIRDITFSTDEYGYYLDKTVASGSHDCLFTPFKIMVDVECCPDRIGHRGTTDPTNLNYLAQIPGSLCGGWISDPPCDCGADTTSTSCVNQNGAWFPTLQCLTAITITEVLPAPQRCYDGLPEDPECTGHLRDFWYPIGPRQFLIDTTGGDPNDYFVFHTGSYYSASSSCGDSFECIIDAGDPAADPPIDPTVLIGEYSTDMIGPEPIDIGEDGKFYLRSSKELHYAAVFRHDGKLWRFGNALSAHPESTANCCNCVDSDPLADPLIIECSLGEYPGGCNCDFTVCGAAPAVAAPLGIGVYWEPWDTPGSGVNVPLFLEENECMKTSYIKPCPYPSYLKINISEDI
jgi:hypothetical protein